MKPGFTESIPRLDFRFVIVGVALVAVLFYLLVSALIFRVGFPLDDSWIHLTYARNLAEHGEWAYRLGERSAGSTSPLWTGLLAIGFLLRAGPYLWTYFLGWVILSLVGIYSENLTRRLVASYRPRLPWMGVFFVLAWHLTWSAVSGMETLLHALLILVVLGELMAGSRRYLTLGLLAGLSIWVRPDGITLLGPVLFVALLSEAGWSRRGAAVWKTLIGIGSMLLPYLLFNLALSGNPMPNTFYAKQAEFEAYWLSQSMGQRIRDYLWPFLASPFLALMPGVFVWAFRTLRGANWGAWAALIWFCGYILIYFMRLPAYQHGRYIIPALPIIYMWGLMGLLQIVSSPRTSRRLILYWQMTVAVLSLGFVFVAARQNAHDVYWIESEMVETARWVESNLPPDAVLAVHDIGALGYHVQNPLIDLAGLVTPEVVPFIRDEARLIEFLDASGAQYLIVFPGLYPRLTSGLEPEFVAGLDSGPLQFEEDMQVYRWE